MSVSLNKFGDYFFYRGFLVRESKLEMILISTELKVKVTRYFSDIL